MVEPRALLLSMPWAALGEPSLGLAILKTCLEREGVPARIRHLNLFLLRYLRAGTYVGLANAYALNDFMFTHALDPEVSGVQYRLARERALELLELQIFDLGTQDPDEVVEKLIEARRTIFPRWLDECAQFVAEQRPTLVGMTCLFDQTMASVALARRVRERLPSATIVLGGYAVEGPISRELLRCFPWIDAVCMGEGEPAIGALARASVGRECLDTIPNVLTRNTPRQGELVQLRRPGSAAARREPLHRAPPVEMDTVPLPSFDDYFRDLDELTKNDQVEVRVDTLPVEASRGCWWGQTHHCVFCGIDDETMQYRARSADNTLAMLDELSRRYRVTSFRFSDYILPHTYFRTLLPKLAERSPRYHLECETKANLRPDQLELMKAAGFSECQPGIESFSTPVLAKMDKGITGIQNIQTLVQGAVLDIRIHYNFLYGFPDDALADYERLLTVIPLLYHLDPPHGRQPVEITRFAPLQVDPKRFDIPRATHAGLYEVLFSPGYLAESGFDLDSYAYYFERTFWNSPALDRVYDLLVVQIDHWKTLKSTRPVQLTWHTDGEEIVFRDSRFTEEPEETRFGPTHRALYEACAGKICSSEGGEESQAALVELVEARFVLEEGRRRLGLAIPPRRADAEQRFQRLWVAA